MEKCLCQQAKESVDDAYAHPILYHEGRDEVGSKQLRDITEAEMFYWRVRYTCTCRKRPRDFDQDADPKAETEEPENKRAFSSDNEAEDGSGSEREPLESDVEEEEQEAGETDTTLKEQERCMGKASRHSYLLKTNAVIVFDAVTQGRIYGR